MTKNGHTAGCSSPRIANEYATNVSAHIISPANEMAATYFRLYLSATLPLTNTNSAIGPNSARPSQPISSERPVMS